MVRGLTALLVLLFMPYATAFDCNSLNSTDQQFCETIKTLDLSENEKNLLLADIYYKSKDFPLHDFIYTWNTGLNVIEPPKDVEKQDKGAIKGAWMKTLALMPSVIENNTLYAYNKGKLQTEYNYSVEIPSGTSGGDCRTEYFLDSDTVELNVYLNNGLVGKERLTAFTINNPVEDLNFETELNINVKTRIEHYGWRKYCCRWDWWCWFFWCWKYCGQYCHSCDHSGTEIQEDTLNIKDNLKAKYYDKKPSSNLEILDFYLDTTKGLLKAHNFTNLIFSFKNSFYRNKQYIYALNYSYYPYYVLTLKAYKLPREESDNIYVKNTNDTSFWFVVKNTEDCKLKLFNHFESFSKDCDLGFEKIPLVLLTDSLSYYEGEIIKVKIFPTDVPVVIEYAGLSQIAKGSTEFKAVPYHSRITARAGKNRATVMVHVKNRNTWLLMRNVLILILLVYLIFKIFEKWGEKLQ